MAKTPEYKKIISRITVEDSKALTALIDEGFFNSYYDITQTLLALYLPWLEGATYSAGIENMFEQLKPATVPKRKKDKGRQPTIKIICRLPADMLAYYEGRIMEQGFKSWYALTQALCLSFIQLTAKGRAEARKGKTINEEVTAMFQEFTDWESPEYIKPHRAYQRESVYDGRDDPSEAEAEQLQQADTMPEYEREQSTDTDNDNADDITEY